MSGFVVRTEEHEIEIQSKVVLVGDAGVGKSCFMKKFVDGILFYPLSFFYLSLSLVLLLLLALTLMILVDY